MSRKGMWYLRRYLSSLRGQSEVVGTVLVIGMVLAGATIIVGAGALSLNESQDRLSEDRAEKTLTQFDSKAGLVALGEAGAQETGLPGDLDEDYRVDSEAGWMSITIENASDSGYPVWLEDQDGEVVNVTLGEFAFENDRSKIAYQGGGVFRATDQGGMMISPPEFHYRGGTLTLPLVNITSDGTLSRNARVSGGETTTVFPDESISENARNPLIDKQVTVTVQSEFYEGWASYFEQRTESTVNRYPDEEKVKVTLTTPFEVETVESSITMTSPGEFIVRGDGSIGYQTESYDSRIGTFEEEKRNTGDIIATGDVTLGSGDIDINGSIYSESGTIECRNNNTVAGYIMAPNGNVEDCDGVAAEESGPPDVDIQDTNADWGIDQTVNEVKENNDNDAASVIDENDELRGGGNLTGGDYYLDVFELDDDDEELKLDTTSGDIRIIVEKGVKIEGDDAKVNITGEGHASFWINGSDTVFDDEQPTIPGYTEDVPEDWHFLIDGEGEITTDGDKEDATRFAIFGKSDFKMYMEEPGGGSKEPIIHGLIYAPGDDSWFYNHGGTVYGGVVSGTVALEHSRVRFDQALSDEENLPEGPDLLTITHLHITENEIQID